jgi:2,4-dienoyl-CoA reductase-like NADH-dependent reductase (Old Yellow Enzyme family)
MENRLRFGIAVFDAVRRRVRPDFLIGARLVCDEEWERGLIRDEGMVIARNLTGSGRISAHPGLSAAEFVAESGAKLEIVTPERMLAPNVGGPPIRPISAPSATLTPGCR